MLSYLQYSISSALGAVPARPATLSSKKQLVDMLLEAKEKTGKTFTEIGQEIGCTNFYTAALFYNQQQLKPVILTPLPLRSADRRPPLIGIGP